MKALAWARWKRTGTLTLLPLIGAVILVGGARGQGGTELPASHEEQAVESRTGALRPAGGDGGAPDRPTPDGGPRAVALVEGKCGPGRVVTLRAEASPGGDLRYQWVQSRGALVRFLDGATAPSARIQLPDSSGPLEFLLVVSHPGGVASAALTLYVPAPGEDDPVADAGDALRGTVGQPVQLDGARSEPRGHLVYKWIALAGPDAQPVALDASGAVATFTPRVPGLYRFLLVVASARAISDPDAVDVLVVPPPPPPPPTIEQVAATALEAVDGGAAAAGALGEVFDALAGRIDLYRSYEDVYQEMSRRLEAIVPDDPARRAAWAERVFVPLTARLIEGLRAEGLDLTRGEGPSAAMTEDQKARLADLLRGISGGFRAAGATP